MRLIIMRKELLKEKNEKRINLSINFKVNIRSLLLSEGEIV